MPKIRLLIITNRFVIGGPAFHVADLARRLQSDFEVLIIGGEAAKGEENNLKMFSGLNSEPILIEGFSRKFNPFLDWRSYYKIKKLIRDFKPQIVHTHTLKPGLLGRWAARVLKVPCIVHTYHGTLFHGYFGQSISTFLIHIERYFAKFSHQIIALSPQQAYELSTKYKIVSENKLKVIYPGIDFNRLFSSNDARKIIRENYKIPDDTLVLGAMGRLVDIKNLQLFLEGIYFLKSHNVKIKGLLIGDGPQKRILKDYCISLGLSYAEFSVGNQNEDIIFTSWFKEIGDIYSVLDGVALTSRNEGTPYSIIEAQMVGLPVIAARVGGVADVVLENKSALLFSTKEEFFAQLLKWANGYFVDNNQMIENQNWAKNRFGADKMANETKTLFFNLIQGG